MAANVAEPLLGSLYTLFVDAFGPTVGWWLGHATLVVAVLMVYTTITNWEKIRYGFGITDSRVAAWLTLLALTGGQVILYQNHFGFPPSGAFITAISVSGYLWWQWYQFEPHKS